MDFKINDIINMPGTDPSGLTSKDFKSNLDVRWCAGCGDYSVLAIVQRVMPTLGIPKEKIAIISGIGCSSRFPYYMDTYGMHTIHGRAMAIASGLKFARPDLSVWVPTGDGDCLSIGGNHFIHACRRNIDLNVIMFNNEIYSLTKGQYSPTSKRGQITKTSPLGVIDNPFNPSVLALAAGASFVARVVDVNGKQMQGIIERAAKHRGMAFVEVYTNCAIFNDGAFADFRDKLISKNSTLNIEHGQPLVFGENNNKGLKLDGSTPVIFDINKGNNSINDAIVHDETDSMLAFILANMSKNPNMPRVMGILQAIEMPTYDCGAVAQVNTAMQKAGDMNLDAFLRGKEYWQGVEE